MDASLWVEADDHAGLQRRLALVCETPFALEHLALIQGRGEALVYRLPKALPHGKT